ncbi:MAG TPA: Asp-tRNA(Asn)/Glu-tRNA(Gln) amidotransferase subunit GatA [Verrucomicrobiae bacterium]|nr:Asp-tRNA(Asn)/Glu-tRNA(Gln) amidotransferase subunit GatA [Verrucomicrobiae bacterium]
MSAAKDWTVASIRSALEERTISARELTSEFFARIERRNPELNAFLALAPERAYAQADRIDALRARGEKLPALAGVPVAIKDVLSTRGIRTTCGSRILENYIPPYDATTVARLENAGTIILGKTNCDEFAMGSSNENSAYGPVRNPVALDRVPGGSSGGSAAAVAARLAVGSLGTDTGGSVRQPGALCGIPALMPTYGRVSRYGLIAFASSLDHVGPFANNTADIAALLTVIAGRDERDSTSADVPVPDYSVEMQKSISGMRIGIPKEYFGAGMHSEVRQKVEKSIELLKKLGCQPVDLSMPHTDYAIATYYIVANAEASANLARFDGVRYGLRVNGGSLHEMYKKTRGKGFGSEVKRRIMLGTYALSSGYYDAYYLRAQKVRSLITRDFTEAFRKVDVIVTPTSPTPAFRIGERSNNPLAMYLSDIYTVTGDLAGVPAISVPCGTTSSGLPIGLQVFGSHFAEGRILQVAKSFEDAGGFAG